MQKIDVKKILQKRILKKIIPFEVPNLPGRTHKNQHNNHKSDICRFCSMQGLPWPCQTLYHR